MKIVISYQQIQTKVSNKESQYLKSIITGEEFFPCSIPCNKKESGNFLEDTNSYSTLMKKSKNNIIGDWLKKHGTKEVEEQVKLEIKRGVKSPLYNVKSKTKTPRLTTMGYKN